MIDARNLTCSKCKNNISYDAKPDGGIVFPATLVHSDRNKTTRKCNAYAIAKDGVVQIAVSVPSPILSKQPLVGSYVDFLIEEDNAKRKSSGARA